MATTTVTAVPGDIVLGDFLLAADDDAADETPSTVGFGLDFDHKRDMELDF